MAGKLFDSTRIICGGWKGGLGVRHWVPLVAAHRLFNHLVVLFSIRPVMVDRSVTVSISAGARTLVKLFHVSTYRSLVRRDAHRKGVIQSIVRLPGV